MSMLSTVMIFLSPAFGQASDAARLHLRMERPLRAVVDLRAGVASAPGLDAEAAGQFCGRVSPHRRWAVEACGGGAGVLHNRDGVDFAHFRLRAEPWQRHRGDTTWAIGVSGGLAEVQASRDAPGFRLGPAKEGQVEAAGPEVAVGLTSRRGSEKSGLWVMDLTAGVAHIEGAPAVMGVDSPVVPFVGLTMGIGL